MLEFFSAAALAWLVTAYCHRAEHRLIDKRDSVRAKAKTGKSLILARVFRHIRPESLANASELLKYKRQFSVAPAQAGGQLCQCVSAIRTLVIGLTPVVDRSDLSDH